MPVFPSLRLSNGHGSSNDMSFMRGKEKEKEKQKRKRKKLVRHSNVVISRSMSCARLPGVRERAEDSSRQQPQSSWSSDQIRSLYSKSTDSRRQKLFRSDTALDKMLHPDQSYNSGRSRTAALMSGGLSRAGQSEVVKRGNLTSLTIAGGHRIHSSETAMRTSVHFDSSDESHSDSDSDGDMTPTISPLSERTPLNSGNHWRRFFPEISSHFSEFTVVSPASVDILQAEDISPIENIVSKDPVQSTERKSGSSSSSQETLDCASSCYSRRTSITSIDSESPGEARCQPVLRHRPSEDYAVISPVVAGVFDDTDSAQRCPTKVRKASLPIEIAKNKPLPLEPPIELAPLTVRRINTICTQSPSGTSRDNLLRPQMADSQDLDVLDDCSTPDQSPESRSSKHHPTLSQAAQELEDELSKLAPQLDKLEESPEVVLNQPLQISRGSMQMIATRPPPTPPRKPQVYSPHLKAASPSSPREKRAELRRPSGIAPASETKQQKKPGKHKLNFSFSVRKLRKPSINTRSFSVRTPKTIVEDSDPQLDEQAAGKNIRIIKDGPLTGSVESSCQTGVSEISSPPKVASLPRSRSSSCERKLLQQLPRLQTDNPPTVTPSMNTSHTVGAHPDMEQPSQLTEEKSSPKVKREESSSTEKVVPTEEGSKYLCPNCSSHQTRKSQVLERKSRPRLDQIKTLSNVFELDAGPPSPSIKIVTPTQDSQIVMPVNAPERIILTILESLDELEDLFNCARLNKRFYYVFKRHELPLMKNTLFKMSPAAWELREMSPPWGSEWESLRDPDAPVPEYTPTLYLRHHAQDLYTVAQLKSLILVRCGSFLRRDTVRGLAGVDGVRATEIDEAFWRIWTFCRIFGCGKNRENDIAGQIDWLNGGRLARQPGRALSTLTTEPFGMNNVLLEPPPGFACGNGNGLSPGQLYDMTEIWTCLGVLLQPIHGKCTEARKFGIYDGLDFKQGDIPKEEAMLEEWTYYVLSLGPSAVLSLSSVCPNASAEATFSKAQRLGLTKWEPPESGTTRASFLKEAVSRAYQTRVVGHSSPGQQPSSRGNSREQSPVLAPPEASAGNPLKFEHATVEDRRRQAAFAAELRNRRQQQQQQTPHPNGNFVADEQPVSGYPAIVNQLDGLPDRNISDNYNVPTVPVAPATPMPMPTTQIPTTYVQASLPVRQPPPHPPPFYRQVEDPVDRALEMLVNELGFSEEDAKWALKITDTGDSIDPDAAVNLLLKERKKRERNQLLVRLGRGSSNNSNSGLMSPLLSRSPPPNTPGWRWA